MRRVTPEQFADAFLYALSHHANELNAHWDLSKPAGYRVASYTQLIRENLLPTTAGQLGLHHFCSDYYTLDAIFYSERDTENFGTVSTYAKFIEVAIEHELNAWDAHRELNKLQLFNSPLKVLITYATRENDRQDLLRKFEKLLAEADCFGDVSTLRRQLVIFGSEDDITNWACYRYANGALRQFETGS